MLEDQLANSRKRIETVEDLESELERCRQHLGELSRVTVILLIYIHTHIHAQTFEM